MNIKPIPTMYAGVQFRSTLEADWAATLDSLGIAWQYEPEGVELPSGVLYRPDFYLPQIATWLEVKGPHGERLDKTAELARTVFHWPDCPERADELGCCPGEYQLVVVGLAPERGILTWRLIDLLGDAEDEGCLAKCRNCGAWWWFSGIGSFGCRKHRRHTGGDEDFSGNYGDDLPFVRAPRSGRLAGGAA